MTAATIRMPASAPRTSVALLDELLQRYARVIGGDFPAYRNHTYRVVNFCAAFGANDAESLDKVAIAAAFHDLGIWTAGTFDYLAPSAELAREYLARLGRTQWTAEIVAMIEQHHKISRYRATPGGLVEPFRKADWVDVTRGLLTFGLARTLLRAVFAAFPDAGFHKRLVQLALGRLVRHPFNPLPMYRL